MVKKFISTAIAMLAISSAANAASRWWFPADNAQDFGVFKNNIVSFNENKEGSSNIWINNLEPLEQTNDNDMACLNQVDLHKKTHKKLTTFPNNKARI